MKKSKLSKQQIFILECLKDSTILEPYYHRGLSWAIAKKFDKNGDRINLKKEILTPKHRASVSRSLKRLVERDLIKDIYIYGSIHYYLISEEEREKHKQIIKEILGDRNYS